MILFKQNRLVALLTSPIWFFFCMDALLSARGMEETSTQVPKIESNYAPKNGYVAGATTAAAIAEAVLVPRIGKDSVVRHRPYRARFVGDVWEVKGTSRKWSRGGVGYIWLSKSNGRILGVLINK